MRDSWMMDGWMDGWEGATEEWMDGCMMEGGREGGRVGWMNGCMEYGWMEMKDGLMD